VQLTKHTDYGLRTLVYLAMHPGRRVSTAEIAEIFDVPQTHLTKVVGRLASGGIVTTHRGRGGGSELAMSPDAIHIGTVVRQLEGEAHLIDCNRPLCPILRACNLRGLMRDAQNAFLDILDNCTLQDVIGNQHQELSALLVAPAAFNAVIPGTRCT